MKNNLLLIIFIISINFPFAQSQKAMDYINKFKSIAIKSMQDEKVPASITLAQGVFESGYGESYLAANGNNHFGIKCHQWKGDSIFKIDDDYVGGVIVPSCFRKYDNAEDSYRDHIFFLRSNRIYNSLFELDVMDYKGWARGLLAAGYATNPQYAGKLIELIERYRLYEYDQEAMSNTGNMFDIPSIIKVNDVELVIAKEGETPMVIAAKILVSVEDILLHNVHLKSPTQKIAGGTRVFLEAKKKKFHGDKKWHKIKKGETMFDLSQLYGIRLFDLYHRNRMDWGTEPAVGEEIMLKGLFKRGSPPKLRKKEKPKPDKPIDEVVIPVKPVEEEVTPEKPDEVITHEETTTEVDTLKPYVDLSEFLSPPEEKPYFYAVKSGDTLYSISRKFGISVFEIMRNNDLKNYELSIGQRLKIKK